MRSFRKRKLEVSFFTHVLNVEDLMAESVNIKLNGILRTLPDELIIERHFRCVSRKFKSLRSRRIASLGPHLKCGIKIIHLGLRILVCLKVAVFFFEFVCAEIYLL